MTAFVLITPASPVVPDPVARPPGPDARDLGVVPVHVAPKLLDEFPGRPEDAVVTGQALVKYGVSPGMQVQLGRRVLGPVCRHVGQALDGAPEVRDEAADVVRRFVPQGALERPMRASQEDCQGTSERLDIVADVAETVPNDGRDPGFSAEIREWGF